MMKESKVKNVSEEDIQNLFCNSEFLFATHLEIFGELDKALEVLHSNTNVDKLSIGNIFLKRKGALEGYVKYVANFSQALETLHHVKKNKQVSSLLKSCEKLDTTGSNLTTLLSMP